MTRMDIVDENERMTGIDETVLERKPSAVVSEVMNIAVLRFAVSSLMSRRSARTIACSHTRESWPLSPRALVRRGELCPLGREVVPATNDACEPASIEPNDESARAEREPRSGARLLEGVQEDVHVVDPCRQTAAVLGFDSYFHWNA